MHHHYQQLEGDAQREKVQKRLSLPINKPYGTNFRRHPTQIDFKFIQNIIRINVVFVSLFYFVNNRQLIQMKCFRKLDEIYLLHKFLDVNLDKFRKKSSHVFEMNETSKSSSSKCSKTQFS